MQEAITGRMLAHPHVVLTYAAEVLPVTEVWLEVGGAGVSGGGFAPGTSAESRANRASLEDRQVEEVRRRDVSLSM